MKIIGIYPGNYQPPTKAHAQTYKKLKSISGVDTFIVTTDNTPTPEAPLNFGDKGQIWVRHGVPLNRIFKVQNWKNPVEVFNDFSQPNTKVVFAINKEEVESLEIKKEVLKQIKDKQSDSNTLSEFIFKRKPKKKFGSFFFKKDDKKEPDSNIQKEKEYNKEDLNKEVWIDNDGKLSYFQPYEGNESSTTPLTKHGYVYIIDDTRIEGRPVSTSNIRQVFGSEKYSNDEKKKFFKFIFGWFDIGLYSLISSKFKSAQQSLSADELQRSDDTAAINNNNTVPQSISSPTIINPNIREKIQKLVNEILEEVMKEDYGSSSNTNSSNSNNIDNTDSYDMSSTLDSEKSDAQKRSDANKKKIELSRKKQQAERDLDGLQKDLKWKQTDILRKRKDELPAKRKELDAINKQLSKPLS